MHPPPKQSTLFANFLSLFNNMFRIMPFHIFVMHRLYTTLPTMIHICLSPYKTKLPTNVNLISKSQVCTPQHLHSDGVHMGLVLIMSLLNGDDGYNINFILKSHTPAMTSHNRNMIVPKSLLEVKNIQFQKN